MLQIEARPGCTVVAGVSGSGKTSFALRYLVAREDFTCRYAIESPKMDIHARLGLCLAETPEELELAGEDGFVIFNPAQMFPGDRVAALEWFADWSYYHAAKRAGRKILFVDEVWRYCNPQRFPIPLGQWVLDGRGLGMETIFCTQEPNKLPSAIVNERTEAVCFRLQGDKALDEVEGWSFDRSEVFALPPGSFVALNCETGVFLRDRVF